MAVALGVADSGVKGNGVTDGFVLPQATRPARAISSPERERTNKRKDMLVLPGMRFMHAIIQQVNGTDEIGQLVYWILILNLSFGSCFDLSENAPRN
jgi:hypothetical protein